MSSAAVRVGTILSTAVLCLLALLVLPTWAMGGEASDVTCTPQQRGTAISAVNLDEARVSAYQRVQAYFQGELPADACPGDRVDIRLPSQLSLRAGTYPVSNVDGVALGSLVLDAGHGVATITFNDYVSTHQGGSFYGYLSLTVSPTLSPGRRHTLLWHVGATTLTTPVTTNACPHCGRPRTSARKWARLDGPSTVRFALESLPARHRREVVTFVDHVARGQRVQCRGLSAHVAHVGQWGRLVWDSRVKVRVTRCGRDTDPRNAGGTVIRARARAARRGDHVVLAGSSSITRRSLERYSDFGVVTQRRRARRVSAAATRSR